MTELTAPAKARRFDAIAMEMFSNRMLSIT